MPTSDKRMAAIITAGMNNTPSSEALMKKCHHGSKKHASNNKDDGSRIYRQLPVACELELSPASSMSQASSCSGLATPVLFTPSNPHFESGEKASPNHITKTQWCAVAILTFINLINYMDRYTIAGKFQSNI